MKIAIEAQRIFRPNKHGMDFVALETIRELQKMDHENEYFIFVSPGEDKCLESSDNVHIIELKCPTYPLWEQVALPRAVKSIKPDLLHCTSNTAPLHCPVPRNSCRRQILTALVRRFSGSGEAGQKEHASRKKPRQSFPYFTFHNGLSPF